MSSIQQWLTDLEKLAVDHSKFQAVALNVETQVLTQQELQEKIQQLGAITGWIQETSKVHTLDQQIFQKTSFILNGEWVQGDVKYAVEHLGRNQWELKQYQLQACESEQATHLAEKIVHCEVGAKSTRHLIYQRLWQPEKETSAPISQIAIFSGFQG
ncbi:hypothetical protein RFI02_12045 [Acinetobacter sichuanensis]|uniref:hypothetical protein n=1 Tax=Acinetobacter sichuanensis TaxID=2136183 RepID=UPI0028106602|nr:hypothetical protein [Acinetobacter sichuanensis]MDQ9021837.1 hypothetical protein [Acinetobacter sichuanensis]